MKKLTLNETWIECLKMWKWIAGQKRKGDINSVCSLKRQWLKNNGYCADSVSGNCFFCEYANERGQLCVLCPGKIIDRKFSCSNSDYDYFYRPADFYKKLKRLNKIRLKK